MDLQDEFTTALINSYQQAGDEVGYWGRRFLQAVKRNGGLATARRMLRRTSASSSLPTKGLDAMLKADRPDLTVEAIVLLDQFKPLFTLDELKMAEERLGEYGKQAAQHSAEKQRPLYPDELEPGQQEYTQAARKQIRVNAYERNPRARRDCLKHHGFRCSVCDFLFEQVYGELGKDFIHVHHLRPLALYDYAYKLNAVEDLRPICPNCHAMLHHSDKVLSIEELRARMSKPS